MAVNPYAPTPPDASRAINVATDGRCPLGRLRWSGLIVLAFMGAVTAAVGSASWMLGELGTGSLLFGLGALLLLVWIFQVMDHTRGWVASLRVWAAGDAASYLARARRSWSRGDPERCQQDLETACQLDGNFPDVHALQSEVHLAGNRMDGAEAACQRALTLSPDHPHGLTQRGAIALRRGQARQAFQQIEYALAASHQLPAAYAIRSYLLAENANYAEAIQDATFALQSASNSSYHIYAVYAYTTSLFETHRFRTCRSYCYAARKAGHQDSQLLYLEAWCCIQLDDAKNAMQLSGILTSDQLAQWRWIALLGFANADLSQFSEAEDYLDQLAADDESAFWRAMLRAKIHWRRNEMEDAIQAYVHAESVADSDGQRSTAWHNTAVIYQSVGCFLDAQEYFRRSNALAGEGFSSLRSMAWLLATCPDECVRDPDHAIELIREVMQRTDERVPEDYVVLAAGHAAAGDFKSAVRCRSHAERLDATLPSPWTHRSLKKEFRAGRALTTEVPLDVVFRNDPTTAAEVDLTEPGAVE
ncbi:MAG: hypothetical protein AAGA03_14965 [Planctomycetota bacterium]